MGTVVKNEQIIITIISVVGVGVFGLLTAWFKERFDHRRQHQEIMAAVKDTASKIDGVHRDLVAHKIDDLVLHVTVAQMRGTRTGEGTRIINGLHDAIEEAGCNGWLDALVKDYMALPAAN